MFWDVLSRKISEQPILTIRNNRVYAALENPKTGKMEKVFLDLKFDAKGRPYFIKDNNH